MNKPLIGFIGQGFVGKNIADDFEERGFTLVRYSLEPAYADNKEKISECDVVFIAVPTPTRPTGFDDSLVRNVIKLVGKGKIAVIKSTIVPGTTASLQKENPDIFVFHAPEFLLEATAVENARHPDRTIIGIPLDVDEYREKAQFLISILPEAPYSAVLKAEEAELVKYIGNSFLYTKVVFMNLMYDLAQKVGADWTKVSEAVGNDPRIGMSHTKPVHSSSPDAGVKRGAGGHCFIKDFEALTRVYEHLLMDPKGREVLRALQKKNNELLLTTKKDLDILKEVYGDEINSVE
jgi:UDPglucose 6-dehydrogenase